MEQQIELKREKVFFPNLDGLRFFAFFAVLLRHSGTTDFTYIKANSVYIIVKKYFFMNGLLGVNFFFVLSGFLITYLLLDEKSVLKKIDIKSFYVRRILRIWPVYYLTLLIGFVLIPFVKDFIGNLEVVDANPWYYIAFLGNFYSVYIHPPNSPMLDRLWSIAVEEQYYLVWPLVIAFFPVKKLPWAFGFLLIVSAIFRFQHNDESEIILFHPIAAMSDLVIGSWAAYLIFFSKKFKSYFENMPRWHVVMIYVLTFLVLCLSLIHI
jgi:peptidoglycan/LPS O-acetylase OafA/YrhL